MTEVILHVYDLTNSCSERRNNNIMQINRIFKDTMGLGGVFHSAVQVYGNKEWSFGFCQRGSGVYSCSSGNNTVYTYRERIVLGRTHFSIDKVNQILRELSKEWPGSTYNLLARNCNHFCYEFCARLGVRKPPGWVNRLANSGDTAMVVAGNTASRFRQAKTEIVSASKVAYRFLLGPASNSTVSPDSPTCSNSTPRLQATWFKNLIKSGARPSVGSEVDSKQDEDDSQHKTDDAAELPLQKNSRADGQ